MKNNLDWLSFKRQFYVAYFCKNTNYFHRTFNFIFLFSISENKNMIGH